jgi:mono/diheme cytochrome c family protein
MSESKDTCASARVAMTLFLAILPLCSPTTVNSAETEKLERGKAILHEKCARCHAIGEVGESPLKLAPPMRDIYSRYAPRELQAELMEGIVSRHRDMPQIDFSEEDADAILLYLHALATRK